MKINLLLYRIILIIFSIFIFQTSFCQENYLPGYIITLKGDTVNGFIDYRNLESNPNILFFKEKQSDNETRYAPLDIKMYCVGDEIYEGAIVKTGIGSSITNQLEFTAELKIETDTTFLQNMIQGLKSLYYYRNKFHLDQFYIKKDTTFELLVYKKYFIYRDGVNLIDENNRFLSQLSLYLYDCPTIQSKLKDLKYAKKNLENLFLVFYKCTNAEIKYHKKSEKNSIEFGILAGISMSTIKFSSSESFAYLVSADYSKSVNFTTGLFINIVMPRNNGKWSIANELNFTSYKVNGYYNDYKSINEYKVSNTSIGFSYIKMINVLRYKYPIDKIFVFLNAGISNALAINKTNYLHQESKFFSQVRIIEDKAIKDVRKYEQGYTFGLGTKFKKYSFEFRLEKSNGMSSYVNLGSSTTKYYFLFGYEI